MLASGDDKSVIRLWNVADRTKVVQLAVATGHTGHVTSVAFSPDGHVLASGSGDTEVRLWDLANLPPTPLGEPLTGHSGPVWSVASSPDGRTVASAAEDGAVRLWDVGDPDDFGDRTAKLWRLDVDRAIERICATSRNVLTPEQWRKHVGQPDFAPACP